MATSKQPRGLGRGLGALLGDLTEPLSETQGGGVTLPIQKIEPNPDQPRKDFDEAELLALADSIATHGLISPLAVRRLDSGYYQIIAGERRWRAARMAGLSEVPAVVLEADDRAVMELALIENLQRQDLNPVEEARGYEALMSGFQLTQEEAAQRVGKSRPAVANSLRLLSLSPGVLDLVADGSLSAGHARALLALKDAAVQRRAAEQIIAGGLSVRQAEALCRALSRPPRPEPPKPAVDYLEECRKALSRQLGRGVKIVGGPKKGRIELEYYDPDDLQALYERLMERSK